MDYPQELVQENALSFQDQFFKSILKNDFEMPDINSKLAEKSKFFIMDEKQNIQNDGQIEIITNLSNDNYEQSEINEFQLNTSEQSIPPKSVSKIVIEENPKQFVDKEDEKSKTIDNIENELIGSDPNVQNFISQTLKNHYQPRIEILPELENLDEIDLTNINNNKLKVFEPKSDEIFKDYFKNLPDFN